MGNINNNANIKLYPLTHPQKRIWYIEKICPDRSLYNIGGSIGIKGAVNFRILEEAINLFIKNHEGLRLRLIEEDGEPRQYISSYERLKFYVIDFSKKENPENAFDEWVEKEAKTPFKINNEKLFYFALFKIFDGNCGYFVKFHHIISDGWSIKIMTDYICDTYMKLLNGEEIKDDEENSYIDYISNEKKYLSSNRFLKNKSFWLQKFQNLPDEFLYKSSDNISGKRKTFMIEPELSSKIKEFISNNKSSINAFFVMLFLIYLNKTTQQQDIVVGTPVLNRSGKKEKSMFGMFTSTMPFRFVVDDELKVADMMARINNQLMEYHFHQKYPYDLLVQDLKLKSKGYDNLFNIYVNYYNTKLNNELNGFPIENVEFYNGSQIYSLQMVIKDWLDSGNLTLFFDYKVNDYSDQQIDDMYEHLLNLAHHIVMNPNEMLRNLSLLSYTKQKKLLYDFNAALAEYPKGKAIYQLFEEQVEKMPDKIAICFNNIELTYKELNEKSNQLARHLVKRGVKREKIVGLLTTHSIETVIGIFGILKAGGVYLPIDHDYPHDRISYMLEDSGSELLLTNMELPEGIRFNGETLKLNSSDLLTGEASNLACTNEPGDLAYLIYTSGSTGKPKGTTVEHQNLINYICWAKITYLKDDEEVFPLYSSLAFDLTVTSIFTPLISGGRVIVYDDHDNEYVLFRIMKDRKATILKLTPSHMSLLKDMDNSNSSIKRLIVGGENLKVSLAQDIYKSFNGNIDIYNEYGPTETTIGCMIHLYDFKNDIRNSVPIGVPADNVQIYILDNNHMPVPIDTVGELYISGDGVARGYLNRTELTREKFSDNPFAYGKRMYKTGDLARFLRDGKIEYIGRTDQQVKIRGYRIELGEIEQYLLRHDAIKDSVIVDLEDQNRGKYICAYIVKKTDIAIHELKSFLLKYLPDYMIPLYFIELDEIPLTINGKRNRELLPRPAENFIQDIEFVEYRNEQERELINAICEVFHLERVSVKQNFFHLGGDSIKAIQISSKLFNKGLSISVKDILSNPLIEEMTLYINKSKRRMINQEICEGSIKPTPIVSWFLSQNFANPNYYNQSVLLELKQDIDTNVLEIILNQLINRHDSLRINYNPLTGQLFYNNEHLNKNYKIKEHDLTHLPYLMQVNQMEFLSDELKSSFNIENGVLIKACIFKQGSGKKRMLITAHHLVVDGVSWRIILEDISTMVEQASNGQEMTLPAKTHSYQEWADSMANGYVLEMNKEKYWRQILNQDFSFPADDDLGKDTVESSCTISAFVSEDLTNRLMSEANRSYNTETKDLLIVTLLKTIKEFTGHEDIVIELEGHGRETLSESIDVSRTVGWFTSLYLFYMELKSSDLSVQIKTVKEEIRRIPDKGIGFSILKYLLKAFDENDHKYVRFNFLGDFSAGNADHSMVLLKDRLGSDYDKKNSLPFIIEINCLILDGNLTVLLTYGKNKFAENTMQRFLDSYMDHLKTIIHHCCDRETIDFTPSDFDTLDITLEELDSLFN